MASKALRYGLMRASNTLAGISYFPGVDEVPLRQLAGMNASLKRNLFEPGCFGRIPSLFDILQKNGLTFHYFDHGIFDSDATVQRRALSSSLDEDVNVVRLVDLDTASHGYGLGTPSMLKSLRQTDSIVGQLVSNWRRKSPNLVVLCFADHGMIPVEGTVNVERALQSLHFRPSQSLGMFLDSTMARFWGDPDTLKQVRTVLEDLDSGTIMSEKDLSRYHLPTSSVWGNMIFLAKAGRVISPNFFDSHGQVRAMHGYDPETPGLDTIAILHSPGNTDSRHLSRVRMIDILPTALGVLGLEAPSPCKGTSMVNL